MNKQCLSLLSAGLLTLSACGGTGPVPTDYTVFQSSLAREASPDVDDNTFEQLNRDNSQFGWNLYTELTSSETDNVFFSPYSISTALAMTYAGASSNTKTEMAQALNFQLLDDALHPGFNKLLKTIESRNLTANDWQEALTVKLNNTIWPAIDVMEDIEDDYLDTLSVNYGTGVYALDYKNNSNESRLTINDAVSEWTNDIIKDLLSPEDIRPSTKVVLTNTIYMYAPWKQVFPKDKTGKADFNNLDGSLSKIDMMHNNTNTRYLSTSEAEVLAIPYRGGDIELVVFMPTDGTFTSFEQQLSTSFLQPLLDGLEENQLIELSLPKFSLSFDADLIPAMKNLGMTDAFGDQADFSNMGLPIELTAIKHKASLQINESGTKASAATVVVGGPTSVPQIQAVVNVNKPFIFAIHDRPTGSILFMGRVQSL